MSMLQSDPPIGGGPTREFIMKVERVGRLPSPWIWAIYEINRPDALHRSSRSYRSAEDAWAVGSKMWLHLGRPGQRNPQAQMSATVNASASGCDKVVG